MTLLLALGIGGGFYAYERGVAGHANEVRPGGETRPGSGGGPPEQPSGRTQGEEGAQSAAAGASETTTGNAEAGAQAAPSSPGEVTAQNQAGQQGKGGGSTSEANRQSAQGSQNQASGIVSGGEAQAQSASLVGNAQNGAQLFNQNCQGCHGANARGVVGPSLVEKGGPADWQYADFRRALLQGITPDGDSLNATMPRFGVTPLQPKQQPASDQDVADLQAHLKTLQ